MRRPSDQWGPQRVTDLKKLWSDGFSASQIADELGGLTRNAVIGKVNRLGLSGRVKKTCSTPRPRRVPTPHGHWQVKKIAAKAGATLIEPELPPISVIDDEIPLARRKQLLELTAHSCRWIVGDPSKEHFYCGDESADLYGGRPYCASHRARAKGAAPIRITEAERLRRTMQGKKNHVSGQVKAA